MDKDFDDLTVEINEAKEKEERDLERKAKLAEREEFLKKSQREPIRPEPEIEEGEEKRVDVRKSDEYRDAFNSFLVGGWNGLNSRELKIVDEARALQSDKDTAGGFLVTPEQFVNQLIQAMDDMVFARRLGKVISVPNAASLGVPALDNDPVDPSWASEVKTGSEDSTMDFDKRMLYPHPLAQRIKVSKKLLRVARMNVASIVNERLSYRFAIKEENGFLNGTGVNQPLGVFTASANGINTGRDVSTGNTTTAIKADNLIECKYTLKAQYRNRARWAFHRDAIKKIRKLKDGEGQYLWKQGLSDRPDTILEMPFEESEYVPNTFTTGNYVGILGDWSFYWIADALNMNVQVLTELYAETNQNGYIARKETDGMPVLEEAFVRVTLA
jgi:HK97 family phage major capsid protein